MEFLTIIAKVLIYLLVLLASSSVYYLYTRKVNNEEVKSLVLSTVKYVEQVYNSAAGEKKFDKAYERLSLLLKNKNINISSDELEILIEEAVLDCKELFSQKKEIENNKIGF